MDNVWQFLLTALIGITTGAVVPLVLQWRSKRAEAAKTEAEQKDIEDQITERVLKRARAALNGLTSENKELKAEMSAVKEEKEALAARVEILESEYSRLEGLVEDLKEGFMVLCGQLRDAGIEPAISLEELNGGD